MNGANVPESLPLAIDLFCGLGGWSEGLLAEGYRVVGFDVERRPYPSQLVLQDVLTIDGAQFRDAAIIVASPPCQAYSYRAMPWKQAKAKTPEELGLSRPAWWDKPETKMDAGELIEWKTWRKTFPIDPPDNALFDACFRIQREASEAAGRHIPLVVENVRGAVKWVGPAMGKFGSFYLWGDVPALLPIGNGQKVPGFRFDGAGGSFQSASVSRCAAHGRAPGTKNGHYGGNVGWDGSVSYALTRSPLRSGNSQPPARRAASALIAKIPFDLARYIARLYHPKR